MAAIRKALALNDRLAEAHTILAEILPYYTEEDALAVEREYKRALELNPNYGEVHNLYAGILHFRGLEKEAFAEITLARDVDPLAIGINATLGWAFYFNRQFDQAIAQEHKVLDMDPNNTEALLYLGFAYIAQSRSAEALTQFQKMKEIDAGTIVELDDFTVVYAYAKLGRRDEAEKILNELKKDDKLSAEAESPYYQNMTSLQTGGAGTPSTPYFIANLYLGLGDIDQFFHWLTRYSERMTPTPYYDPKIFLLEPLTPIYDSIRSDPRFAKLLAVVDSDNLAWKYYYDTRQNDQAIEQGKKTLTIDPNYAYAYRVMALSALQKSSYQEALIYLQKLMDLEKTLDLQTAPGWEVSYLGYTYAKLGKADDAQKIIGQLKEHATPGAGFDYLMAIVYLGLGELDQVFASLQKGYEDSTAVPFDLKYAPIWDSIRSDPRFVALLKKAGLGD